MLGFNIEEKIEEKMEEKRKKEIIEAMEKEVKKEIKQDTPERSKWWSELDLEEKTARLRRRVRQIEEDLRGLRDNIWKLGEHTHGDGKILVPMDTYAGLTMDFIDEDEVDDDVYF